MAGRVGHVSNGVRWIAGVAGTIFAAFVLAGSIAIAQQVAQKEVKEHDEKPMHRGTIEPIARLEANYQSIKELLKEIRDDTARIREDRRP